MDIQGETIRMRSNLYTVAEAAEVLKIGVKALRVAYRDKRISYRKLGKTVIFTDDDLEQYLERSKVARVEESKNDSW